MQFSSLMEFFQMDGHGLYVWLSYAITAVVVAVNIVNPMMQRKSVIKNLSRRLRRENNA